MSDPFSKGISRDVEAALQETVAILESTIRRKPDQWFQFAPFWPEDIGVS